jgi:23S rRNA (adenine2503-C2)-methyltransferase
MVMGEREDWQKNRSVSVSRAIKSSDGSTEKYIQLTKREGFATIESGKYLIDGETVFCLSTQIGCSMGCIFCRSTEPYEFEKGKKQRLLRDLTDEEITDQALNMADYIQHLPGESGIVFSFMGMGEPFANLNAVRGAIINLGNRFNTARATISTICPDPEAVKNFAEEVANGVFPIQVKLHISMHGSNDMLRKELLPHAAPITATLGAAEEFAKKTGTDVKLNYVLINGLNNTKTNAYELGELLKERSHLILKLSDLNHHNPSYKVSKEDADNFEVLLNDMEVRTCRFTSLGNDIQAGCGELVKGSI